jgi:hypothetical protein
VGTAPVTLFAPADPERVCPFGYRDLVVQAPTACAPCFKYPYKTPHPAMACRAPFCIGSIGVDAVLAAARRAAARAGTALPADREAPAAPRTSGGATRANGSAGASPSQASRG